MGAGAKKVDLFLLQSFLITKVLPCGVRENPSGVDPDGFKSVAFIVSVEVRNDLAVRRNGAAAVLVVAIALAPRAVAVGKA